MFYSELSGPTTAPVSYTPAGSAKAPAGKSTSAAAQEKDKDDKASGNSAYSISQSMEKLLDRMTGKNPGGFGEAAGTVAQSDPSLQRLQDAKRIMDTALQMAKAASKGADTLKSTLGDVLGKLGMSSDRADEVTAGFGDHLQSKLADVDFSSMAMTMDQARSQWSIESHGIELQINDGDRSISISFAKSTLDFQKDEMSLQASAGQGGDFAFGASVSSTHVDAKATGMIVRAEGFSDEEIQGILEKLNGMAGGSSGDSKAAGGLGVLTPQKTDKDGIMHLTLDLAAVLDTEKPADAAAQAPAAAATATPKLLDVSA